MSKEVRFDRSLYLPDAVEAAASAYAEHAKIEVLVGEETIETRISDVVGEDPDFVVHAFCNHVLHETIGRKRQSVLEEVA